MASINGSKNLSEADANRDKIGIVAAMWNHAGQMSQTMTGKKIEWPVIRNGEMNDLVEYIRAQGMEQ
jgi:hypothetical protein